MRKSIYHRLKSEVIHYKLSILIPTLSSRAKNIKPLLDELYYQIQSKPVQVLWLGDNKSMSIGAKRNMLLDIASGEFITFIDDDDYISGEYIDVLMNAINKHSDKTVICFRGSQTTDGKSDLPFRYDISFGRNHKKEIDGIRWKVMLPDHLCCWKREKITERFPDKSLGEDHAWARNMAMKYTSEDQLLLDDCLYHYNFDRTITECRR